MKTLYHPPMFARLLFVLAFAFASLLGQAATPAQAATTSTVVAWGGNFDGQVDVPAGLSGVTAIAAGAYHSLALKSDGTVAIWGDGSGRQLNVPAGLSGVTAIAAGWYHSLALKGDGTVIAWGDNKYGEATPPAGLSGVTAIAGGAAHSLALKSDGTVVAWGDNSYGQLNVPANLSGVTAIAAGGWRSLALKSDGTVVAWGNTNNGALNVPAGLSGVTAIAVGQYHSLALYTPSPDTTAPTSSASTAPAAPNGTNGWFTSDVTITLSASDDSGGSGVAAITYSLNNGAPTTVQADTASLTVSSEGTTTISYYATDTAGNAETANNLTIKLDKTAPVVTATPDRAPNANGWYNAPVSFSLSGNDGSGSAGVTCDAAKSYSGPDSASASVTGTCIDAAGNVGSATANFSYDATKPSVTYSGNAGTYTIDQTVTITCSASDALSGIDSTTCASISGPAYSFPAGTNTFSATATDKAGNTGSGTTSFTVAATYDSLCALSTSFSTDPAVAQGLCDKLMAAKAAAGNTKTKNNILKAYRQQVTAQSGKALTNDQAKTLIDLSKTL